MAPRRRPCLGTRTGPWTLPRHGPPQNVLSDRFLTISDQFDVVSQPGNPFGARPGPTTIVAVGYLGVLRGLPPGHHTFVVSGVAFGGPFTSTWTVNVVPGAHH